MRLLLASLLATLFVTSSSIQAQQSQLGYEHVVPEKCWAMSAWNSAKQYDQQIDNPTVRLMSDPEIRAFVDDFHKRVGLIAPALVTSDQKEKQEAMFALGPQLVNGILRGRGCVFVESIDFEGQGELSDIKAAMIFDGRDQASNLADLLSKTINPERESIKFNDHQFYKLALNPNIPLFIGSVGNDVLIATSSDTINDVIVRLQAGPGQSPKWMTEFRAHKNLKSLNSIAFLNIRQIKRKFARLMPEEAQMMMGVLGVANCEAIESASGLGELGFSTRTLIRVDGRPEGLLALSKPDGISLKSIEQIPTDAIFGVSMSVDARRVFEFARQLTTMSFGRDSLTDAMDEIESETGVHLQHDLIDHIGSTWTFYNGAGDGWLSGLTLSVDLKDAGAMAQTEKKLIKKILMETDGDRYAPSFTRRSIAGSKLTTLHVNDRFPFPFQFSWCISDGQLIAGLYPQAIESALKRAPAQLLDEKQQQFVQRCYSNDSGKGTILAMTYVDAQTSFELSYPYLQMASTFSRNAVREFGNTTGLPQESQARLASLIEGFRIPRARLIHQYLEPSILVIRQSDIGIEMESSQTIPGLDTGSLAPIGVAALLPAVQTTRMAARRTQSANNLRQQVLAALNFESAFRRFPTGHTNNTKNHLLSWRVQVLPFIEQNDLYQQFKLDEPWDSPHNIQLLDKMPEVFRSPVSQAESGMTVYRGIGGPSGVLAPRDKARSKIGFGNITDGSSNTIFVVEASDELAIPWTKPDPGLDPGNIDFQKLFGAYKGGTNVALCDGSVHFVSDTIAPEILKYLMMMNDGHIVDINSTTDEANRRGRPRTEAPSKSPQPVDPRFQLDAADEVIDLSSMLTPQDRKILDTKKDLEKLRMALLAMHNFESAQQAFPAAYSLSRDGQPLLSWRVQLLPYLGEVELYEQFRLNEPWDSEHNRKLLSKVPECYQFGDKPNSGKTTLMAFGGTGPIPKPGRAGVSRGLRFGSMLDGLSNSVLAIVADDEDAVEWTKPMEFVPDEATIERLLAQPRIIGLGDGSCWQLKAKFPIDEFKKMMTISGGEVLGDWYRWTNK